MSGFCSAARRFGSMSSGPLPTPPVPAMQLEDVRSILRGFGGAMDFSPEDTARRLLLEEQYLHFSPNRLAEFSDDLVYWLWLQSSARINNLKHIRASLLQERARRSSQADINPDPMDEMEPPPPRERTPRGRRPIMRPPHAPALPERLLRANPCYPTRLRDGLPDAPMTSTSPAGSSEDGLRSWPRGDGPASTEVAEMFREVREIFRGD